MSHRATLPEVLGVLTVMVVCAAGALAIRDPGQARAPDGACQEILRRYAEARLRQADARPDASTMASHRAAVDDRAEVSRRFARCPEEVGAARAECALRAGGADEIERCLQ